jgi:hypothetical protein
LKFQILGPGPKSLNLTPVGWYLKKHLSEISEQGEFYVAVALADIDGLRLMSGYIRSMLRRNGKVRVIVGIDLGLDNNTMHELIQVFGSGNVLIHHNPSDTSFHPKIYAIKVNSKTGIVILGSSNFTGAGFLKNLEINLAIELDLRNIGDGEFFAGFLGFFEKLSHLKSVRKLDTSFLSILATKSTLQKKAITMTRANRLLKFSDLFEGETHGWEDKEFYDKSVFLMSLSYNDVSGIRGDKYVRIPKNARDTNPRFWGWNALFKPSPRAGHMERFVRVNYDGNRQLCRLYSVDRVSEFRLVLPDVYELGRGFEHSVLKIEKKRREFDIETVSKADLRYDEYLAWCTETCPRGKAVTPKVWGYV